MLRTPSIHFGGLVTIAFSSSHSLPRPTMIEQRPNDGESCRTCLYTGLATCTGLSGYFLYLAMEEELHRTSKPNTLQSTIVNFMRGKPIPKQNRPFLFAMSAAWFVAGGYRMYLN